MIRVGLATSALSLLCLSSIKLPAESRTLTLAVVNGKSGKPMRHQRLVFFMGHTQTEVRFQRGQNGDVTTDEQGLAVLQIPDDTLQWVQVFVDFHTLCQTTPNYRSFNLLKIATTGEATPNNCSSLRREPQANQLTVFARPATQKERQNW